MERERALEIAAAAVAPLPSEEADVASACGRVVAEAAEAASDLPPFDRSTRDGYALRAADTAGGSRALRVAATLVAGQAAGPPLRPGECCRVMTGALLPPGADAVVMQEEVEETSAESIRVPRPVPAEQHVARTGSEVRRGDVLAPAGVRLDPPALGLLLSSGLTRLKVHRLPRAALLATGSELVAPAADPSAGRIRASNPWLLAAALEGAGARTQVLGLAADRPEEQAPRIEEGLGFDLLLLSGGTGRGRADLTRRALQGCGVEILFQGVAVEPGRPVLCGRRGKTLVFGLPGTPLAAWVLWRVLVSPCLRRLAGESRWQLRLGAARLASPLEHAPGFEAWVPADLSWAGSERVARPRAPRAPGSLRQHAGAPALIRLPSAAEASVPAGAAVAVLEPRD